MVRQRFATVAAVDWTAYETEALAAYAAADTDEQLAEVSVRYLGRRAELPQALRQVRDAETGRSLNQLRRRLEDAQSAAEERLEREAFDRRLAETVDVTLPGEDLPLGHLHPITQTRRLIEDTFLGLGYQIPADPQPPDPPAGAADRGPFPRPRLGAPRRPGGRARREHLQKPRFPAVARRALAPRLVLLRRPARAADRDVALADPRPRGGGAAD